MATESDLRRLCLSLPEVYERPFSGLPGFYIRNSCFARIREKPEAVVVHCPNIADKEALLLAQPDIYFQTAHYEGHPAVLVRLESISVEELAEILKDSWSLMAPKKLFKLF